MFIVGVIALDVLVVIYLNLMMHQDWSVWISNVFDGFMVIPHTPPDLQFCGCD
jgi:hypothetical protein